MDVQLRKVKEKKDKSQELFVIGKTCKKDKSKVHSHPIISMMYK